MTYDSTLLTDTDCGQLYSPPAGPRSWNRGPGNVAPDLPATTPHHRTGATQSQANESSHAASKLQPDAPFRVAGRLIIGLVHLLVLAGVVGLLVRQGLVLLAAGEQNSVARVVAAETCDLAAPYPGQFRASHYLSEGEWVEAGQVLGHIDAPELDDELRAALDRRRSLYLMAMRRESASDSANAERSSDLSGAGPPLTLETVGLEHRIRQLRRIRRELTIVSPVRGRLQWGISGNKPVQARDTIAHIWPEGGQLRVQIEAPLGAVHKMLRKGSVACQFPTPQGDVCLLVRPIDASLRLKIQGSDDASARRQVLGCVECWTGNWPAPVRNPGLIGRL